MSINGVQNTSFPLTLSGLTLTDDLSGTYVPYAGAINAIDLNNKAVSNVASLAVVGTVSGTSVTASGTVSGATITASGALSSDTLTVTNNTATGSLTSFPTTYPVANIKIDTSTTIFVVMTPYPASFVVGATVQIYNFNTLPAFNRQYTITSVDAGSSLFYANYTSGLTVGDRYYTSTARAYISNGTGSVSCMILSSLISASLANLTATGTNSISNLTATGTNSISNLTATGTNAISNLTATGTNAISNLTTTGSLTSGGPVICNNTTAIGYWLPSNGTTSIYITDTSANVSTPATTLSRYFATGGAVYQDFYGSFNWRATTGLNSALTTTVMSLTNTTLTVTANLNVTGTLGITGNTTLTGTVGVIGPFGVTGNTSLLGTFTQTGQQTFNLGAFGSSGDYIVPTTNIYGSTVFDGGNLVNIQNQASQYGRNILMMTGRYEASNDAWSFVSPRNGIIFRTQATLNSSATLRYTIQNYFNELGIMSAGKSNVPIMKFSNDGTITVPDNINLGGSLVTTGANPLYLANACAIWAKNSAGTNEVFFHPRYSDNVTYLNYGSAGWNIRNNAGTNVMFLTNAGNVGIKNDTPYCTLDVFGTCNIWTGSRFAVLNNYMGAGSLTLGSTNTSYGGHGNWTSSTCGLMLETSANQEICCHHSGVALHSLLYYQGSSRRIYLGRNIGQGWGENAISCEGTIYATASTSSSLRSTYGQLYISNGYNNNSIIHRHDGPNYYMLISNGAYDTIWNSLRPFRINISTGLLVSDNGQEFRGNTYVGGTLSVNNGDNSYGLYGPNSTWNSYIYVGASTNRITQGGTNACQVISTNGNLHLDSGFDRDIYLNYYNKNVVSGSTGAIRLYGSSILVPDIPAQNYFTANIAILGSSAELRTGQLQTVHFESRGAWGGGVALGDFYKGSLSSAVIIRGDGSYYVSGAGNTTIIFRMYNTTNGYYYYYNYNQFTNVTYNHVSYPFNHFVPNNTLPIGTYNVYMYLAGGSPISDGNDYIAVTITIHP